MSKGLEALERIVGCSTIESHRPKWQEDYKAIKKELKALEIIKKLLIMDDDKQRIDVKKCVEMSDDEYELLKEIFEECKD